MKLKQWIVCIGVLSFASILVTFSLGGIRLNMTESLPGIFWRITPAHTLTIGQAVFVCPPPAEYILEARRRGYLKWGVTCPQGLTPLIKHIAALPGDHVTVSAQGITINGQSLPGTVRLEQDSQGRKMPPLPPAGRVATGQVWLLATTNPRSFDSRYFGPLPIANIIGTATRIAWLP